MPDQVTVKVNGTAVTVGSGATVAVAVAVAGQSCRMSMSGQPRGALCGMGICFECRVSIDSTAHCRSCQIMCEDGMQVSTDQ